MLHLLVSPYDDNNMYCTKKVLCAYASRLATMESNIHISLDYVTTFIVGSNISVVTCKASFIRL